MVVPSNLKYNKLHRKKRIIRVNKGRKGRKLSNHDFGFVLKDSKLITQSQLSAVRKLIVRKLKGKNNRSNKNQKIIKSQQKNKKVRKKKTTIKFNLRQNFSLGLTKKPLQVRMGKGKGNPVDWVYPCARNRVLVEISIKKLKESKARKFLIRAKEKLPTGIKFIKNFNYSRSNINIFKNKVKCIKEL